MTLPKTLLAPLAITRSGVQTIFQGDVSPGIPTALTVNALVQPLSGTDIVNAPEGQRGKQGIKIHADAPLQNVNVATGTKGDLVTWSGQVFEVQSVDAWPFGGLPHWRAIAYLTDPAAQP